MTTIYCALESLRAGFSYMFLIVIIIIRMRLMMMSVR